MTDAIERLRKKNRFTADVQRDISELITRLEAAEARVVELEKALRIKTNSTRRLVKAEALLKRAREALDRHRCWMTDAGGVRPTEFKALLRDLGEQAQ